MKIKMKDGSIREACFEEELGKNAFRHTTAHILAQAVKRPLSDKYVDYAKEIELTLKKEGLRCEVDGRAEKIGCKIRAAQLERIPYMLIVGEKEVKTNSVSVRGRDNGDLGSMSIGQLLEVLHEEGI